jgi:phage tail sheath gpL-like
MLRLVIANLLAVVAVIQQAADPTAQAWGTLFAAVGAVGTSAILAAVKRTDYSVAQNKLFRKIQPALTFIGAVAAPYVASVASSGVDISGLGNAPIATLATVLGAELLAMFKRST